MWLCIEPGPVEVVTIDETYPLLRDPSIYEYIQGSAPKMRSSVFLRFNRSTDAQICNRLARSSAITFMDVMVQCTRQSVYCKHSHLTRSLTWSL
jgi:hypothetical protein